jgi:hypothetical protein
MSNDEVTPEFKKQATEHFQSMDDNTEVDCTSGDILKFVKMNLTPEHIDYVMEHYKLTSMVDLNLAAIYILKTFAHMEDDGYKFSIYSTEMVDGKEAYKDGYGIDIHHMIQQLLTGLKTEK